MGYTFARVSAVLGMNVEDYYQRASAGGSGCTKKAASVTRCPRTTTPRRISTPISQQPASARTKKGPLFRQRRPAPGADGEPDDRTDVLRMIKRRALTEASGSADPAATPSGPPASLPTWRTAARSRTPRRIADHESPRTTKLYDRTSDEITLDEVERIAI